MTETHNCRNCKHFFRDNEGGGIEARVFWNSCNVTNFENLLSFPFEKTKCKKFEDSGKFKAPDFQERIRLGLGQLAPVLSNNKKNEELHPNS